MAEPATSSIGQAELSVEDALRVAMLSLERASDSIYWFDGSARIAWANESACRTLGYAREELVGLSIADINPTYPAQPARREELAANADAASEVLPPWLTVLVGGGSGQVYETVHRRKDGRLVPVEVSAAPIEIGGVRHFVAATRDISSRRWTEAALQNMAGELDRFFEVTLEMLCITDQHGTFRRVNPAWERVLGFTPSDLLSHPQIDFVHPDDRPATLDALQRLGAHNAVSKFSNRFQRKSGGYCWLEWRCATDGEKIFAAVYDASARMASEERPRDPGGDASRAPGPAQARVLVVDDNRLNLRVARQMLEHFGILVETAGDGREALSAMRRGPDRFDAILMDMQMPDMDGLEATRAIRKEFPRHALPIIAATASIDSTDMTACLDAGMNDYVSKPMEPRQLKRVLSRWLPLPAARRQDEGPEQVNYAPEADLAQGGSATALMSVRGVDVAAALIRLNGQHDLLVRLLRVFAQEHGNTTGEIGAAIGRGDLDAALGLVHNLKGVAGTLSATEVFEAARALEGGLRNRQHEALGAQVERLRTALDLVCRSIRECTGEAKAARADDPRQEPHRPVAGAQLTEFDILLKMRRFSARQRFEQLKQQLTRPELAATIEQVQRCLERLEFEQARAHLPAIAAALGVPFRRA